ncbi:MAG: class I tRNA ligase family protein [Candidatus Dormibacteraeota bacterium]|nr:class I tRNA ligase family protein [Candidatus Dormibacteraeota bacterium]
MADTTWITAAGPTPNGDLHIGHLAGPYVAADVVRRHLCGSGTRVAMTTERDEHQSYVELIARRDGVSAEVVADTYGARIERSWKDAEIEFDACIRPRHEPGFVEFVQGFFTQLYEGGDLVTRKTPLPFCRACRRWLYDGHLTGLCPHCGAESGGEACEACGRFNTHSDLLRPTCVSCGVEADLVDGCRIFFPLAPYADQLRAFWQRVVMPTHLRVLCEQMLAEGLPEIVVSHPSAWGIPVPLAGFEDQRLSATFEGAPVYLYQAGRAAELLHLPLNYLTEASSEASWVQFFGFDNGYFYAVVVPALLLAHDAKSRLPTAYVVNELYQLEGRKFSTSRRHAVWAGDLLATTDPDVLRFHVMKDRPVGRQTSFSMAALERTREHLRQVWDGWVTRLLALAADHGALVPPERPHGREWDILQARLRCTLAEVVVAYSLPTLDLRRVTALLDELVHLGVDFGHIQSHNGPAQAEARAGALVAQLVVAQALAAWASPLMPAACARLARAIGYHDVLGVSDAALRVPEPGRRIEIPAGPIFGG